MDSSAVAAATETEVVGGAKVAAAATATATCACCGIGEECTARYVDAVAAQFGGAWVCGLCAEAIKDEAARRGVGLEAATRAHAEFVGTARSGPAAQVVRALLELLKKVLAAAPGAAVLPPPAAPGAQDLDM